MRCCVGFCYLEPLEMCIKLNKSVYDYLRTKSCFKIKLIYAVVYVFNDRCQCYLRDVTVIQAVRSDFPYILVMTQQYGPVSLNVALNSIR